LVKLLADDPAQKNNPHLRMFVMDRDLTEAVRFPDNLFVYGMSTYPSSLVATARLQQDRNLMMSQLAFVAAHEMGHLLGLVNRNFNVGKRGMRVGHCSEESGPCLMAQVAIPGCRSLIEQTRRVIEKNSWLCTDCLDEAAFKKAHLEGNRGLWRMMLSLNVPIGIH
jgi:hypothetical protein